MNDGADINIINIIHLSALAVLGNLFAKNGTFGDFLPKMGHKVKNDQITKSINYVTGHNV